MAHSKIGEADRTGLLHLVDDKGSLKQAFHVDPTHEVTILVVDSEGAALRGRFTGEAGLCSRRPTWCDSSCSYRWLRSSAARGLTITGRSRVNCR